MRITTKLSFLLVLILSKFTYGQYTTPNLNKLWNLDSLVAYSSGSLIKIGEIYIVMQNITISSSDTVKILTDKTILFGASKQIAINGTFIANPPTSIIFSGVDTTVAYNGLRFENSDNSILRKCLYQFGSGIKLINSDIIIDSCIFRKNFYTSSFSSGTIDVFQSNPIISYCKILHNSRAAISSAANASSSPYIHHNEIIENNTSNSNLPQINLGSAGPDSIIVKNNVIKGLYNNCGGIAISTLAGGSIKCLLDSNYIINNRYGFAALGNNISTIISNNIVENNNIGTDPITGGSGFNFNGNNTNIAIIKHNIIRNNLWGITIQGSSLPNIGQINGIDTINIGHNHIYDNKNSGFTYDVYNNTANLIYAHNNYWGTSILDSIESHVYHQLDQANLGLVDYINYVILTNLDNKVFIGSNLIKNIYPNPASTSINIEWNTFTNQPIILELFSCNGKTIWKEEISKNLPIEKIGIDFAPGIYIIKALSGFHIEFHRIVVVR